MGLAMRDILLALIVLVLIPFILRSPYIGALGWAWVSYFSPDALAWSFAQSIRFNLLVAVAFILAFVFTKEPRQMPWSATVWLLLAFIVWMLLSTQFAKYPDEAWPQAVKNCKIFLMTFLTIIVVNTRERINGLVWVIVLSVGFWVIKGGVFSVLTGGQYMVRGPEGTSLDGNNTIGMVGILIIPLFRYLQGEVSRRWLKHLLTVFMVLSVATALGSYSRGALLAAFSMGTFLWWKSPGKVPIAVAILVIGLVGMQLMPERWTTRMDTIETYEEDASAMGRINAWWAAWNFTLDHPVLGGGFGMVDQELFDLYAPNPEDVHDFHSNYFSVLAHHGFPGLALWLLVWITAWRDGTRVTKLAKEVPDLQWAVNLVAMLKVSLMGYFVGGAFLNLGYFDLAFHMWAILVIVSGIVHSHLSSSLKIEQTAQVTPNQNSPWH